MAQSPTLAPSDQSRSWIAVAVSIAALIVSVLAFATPIVREVSAEDRAVHTFLDSLVEPSATTVLVAANRTQAESDASRFVYLLSDIWKAWKYSARSKPVESGTWEGIEGGYRVCFPKIDLLTSECQTFADFQFAENTANITRFSIDKIPVGELAKYGSSSITTTDDNEPRVYATGVLSDPSFGMKTIVLWTALRSGNSFPLGTTYSVTSMQVQTGREQLLDPPTIRFPPNIARYEAAVGAIRTYSRVQLVYSCWHIDPKDEEVCTWLNLSL